MTRRPRSILHPLFSILAFFLFTTLAHADSPASRVRADALLYVHFAGSAHLGDAYANSHLKPVLESSKFPELYHELLPQLLKKALDADPSSGQSLARSLIAGEILAREGFTLAVSVFPTDWMIVLDCDAGLEADALGNALLPFKSPGKVFVSRKESRIRLICSANFAGPLRLNLPATRPSDPKSLADTPAFQRAFKELSASDAPVTVYVDFERLMPLVDALFAEDGPRDLWPAIKPITGLDGLKRYALAASFTPDGGWSTRSFTEAPAPRNGFLDLLHGKSLPDTLVGRVPADATYVSSYHFDPLGWIESGRKIARAVKGEEAVRMVDQYLGFANIFLGRDLKSGLLAPLGTEFVLYTAPGIDPAGQYNAVFLASIADEQKAAAGLTSLSYALSNTVANFAANVPGLSSTVVESESEGLKISTIKLTLPNPQFAHLSPSWAIKDHVLYFALNPKGVAKAATYAGKPFTESPEFAAAKARLASPNDQAASIEYAVVVPETYAQFRTAFDMIAGIASAQAGVRVSINPFPSLQSLQPHLRPMLTVNWTDADGFHSRSDSPFPGASVFTPSGLGEVGTSALVVSVALPSLNRARETANRVKCASNMKQIGSAILLYSNENHGKYPPDLGTLVATQDIGCDAFTCPSSNTPRINPDDVPHKNADELLKNLPAHVNAHTDYVYTGKDLNNDTADGDLVIVYEKPDDHVDGVNMLFADGSVQFFVNKDAERIIAAGRRADRDRL